MALHLTLEEVSLRDVAQCGGKAARLGEAARLGVPVPRSVVLPTELYRRFMRQGGLHGEIAAILGTLQPSAWTHFRACEWAIQNAFRMRRAPEQIVSDIAEACQALDAPGLAVRSSATSEDSPQLSFVGQHYSCLLGASDHPAIVEAVLQCWMSLFSAKALSYAHHFGVDLLNSSMAVLIQQAIRPELRGALYTADPITGNPDAFVLELASDSKADSALAATRHLDPFAAWLDLPTPLPRLRDMGLLLDEHFVQYQAIEWATDAGELYVLRVRPLTSVPHYLPPPNEHASTTRFEWVRPNAVSARAALPHTQYHMSRSLVTQARPLARSASSSGAEPETPSLYVCGYRYVGSAQAADARESARGGVTSLKRCLEWGRAVRSLDRALSATQPSFRADLEALGQLDLTTLSQGDLQAHLQHVCELRDGFVHMSRSLGSSSAVLTDVVATLQRRWSPDGADTPMVAQTSDHRTRRDAELCQIARQRYAGDAERDAAFAAFIHRHRHLYLKGDPLSDGQDLAALSEDEQSARAEFERCSAPENEPAARRVADQIGRQQTLERHSLAQLSRLQRLIFRPCLRLAQRYAPLALDRDEPALLSLLLERDAVREVGRRLTAAGVLEKPDDAFCLSYAELLGWLHGTSTGDELAPRVRARMQQRRRWARYSPPTIYPPETSRAQQLAATDGLAIMALSGRPICRGLVEGNAVVIRSAAEAGTVLPGQVLVCREPQFELSPLFGLVAAVVAESGGLLDPAAVLVREYGIPAVFGVAGATEQLHTGDALLVDADHGRVLRRRPALA